VRSTTFVSGLLSGGGSRRWLTESRPDSVVGPVEGISSIHKALCSVSKIPLGFEASIGLYLLQHGTWICQALAGCGRRPTNLVALDLGRAPEM